MTAVQAKLQATTVDFQKLEAGASTRVKYRRSWQAEMSGVIEARQRLDSQLQENELVLKVCSSFNPTPIISSMMRSYPLAQIKIHMCPGW